MFRIRRIFDDIVPANQYALEQVRTMLRFTRKAHHTSRTI